MQLMNKLNSLSRKLRKWKTAKNLFIMIKTWFKWLISLFLLETYVLSNISCTFFDHKTYVNSRSRLWTKLLFTFDTTLDLFSFFFFFWLNIMYNNQNMSYCLFNHNFMIELFFFTQNIKSSWIVLQFYFEA